VNLVLVRHCCLNVSTRGVDNENAAPSGFITELPQDCVPSSLALTRSLALQILEPLRIGNQLHERLFYEAAELGWVFVIAVEQIVQEFLSVLT
jgi:hypothetical protein